MRREHEEDPVDGRVDQKLDQQQDDHRRKIHAARVGKDAADRSHDRFDDPGQCVENGIEKPVADIQDPETQQHRQDAVRQQDPHKGLDQHQDNGMQGNHIKPRRMSGRAAERLVEGRL